MSCGQQEEHCCWLGKYGQCSYLERVDTEDRVWSCSIRADHDSWEDAYQDSRYTDDVKIKLVEIGIDVDCGDWPQKANTYCRACGYGDVPPKGD